MIKRKKKDSNNKLRYVLFAKSENSDSEFIDYHDVNMPLPRVGEYIQNLEIYSKHKTLPERNGCCY